MAKDKHSKYARKVLARARGERPPIAADGDIKSGVAVKADWEIAREEVGNRTPSKKKERGYKFKSDGVFATYTYLIPRNKTTSVSYFDQKVQIPARDEKSGMGAVTIVALKNGVGERERFGGRIEKVPKWDIGVIRGYSATNARGEPAVEIVGSILSKHDYVIGRALQKWSIEYGHTPTSNSPEMANAERVSKHRNYGFNLKL